MSAASAIASLLAWPNDSGVAGGAIGAVVLGAPAYVHAHLAGRRRHGERLSQADRHHAERLAQAGGHHGALAHLHERHHQRLLDAVAASAPAAAEPQVSAESAPAPPAARRKPRGM